MWKAWVTPYDLSISALHFTPRAPLGNAGTDWVGPKSTRVIPNPTRFAEKTRFPKSQTGADYYAAPTGCQTVSGDSYQVFNFFRFRPTSAARGDVASSFLPAQSFARCFRRLPNSAVIDRNAVARLLRSHGRGSQEGKGVSRRRLRKRKFEDLVRAIGGMAIMDHPLRVRCGPHTAKDLAPSILQVTVQEFQDGVLIHIRRR
jgi:hypothetical protein